MKKILVILLLLPITTFSQIKDLVDGYDLYTYGVWISGEFSSTLQSTEDGYFDNVFIKTVKFRSDEYGDWFYTKQGEIADGIPYRERIYLLNWVNDTTLINRVFKLKTNDVNLDTISYTDLEEMCGCHTYIYKEYNKDGWYYYGDTNGTDCKGSFRGATYTTSQFRVYEDRIISWERGWNGDIQIWGSTKGAYQYLKIK